ncbi:MAG: hypothetical protein IT470_05180 [Pseudomonadales bacterium]|nr:hypothetical protein [Pseudomonadales bacterium]
MTKAPQDNDYQALALAPELQKQLYGAMREFRGNCFKLESALGALLIGKAMGWRVLKIIHSSATYKEYETILGIRFQDACPENTPLSRKSYGYSIAEKLKSFWAVATGKKPLKEKMLLGSIEEVSLAVANMGEQNNVGR